jgi:hypothetical protein
MSVPEAPRRPRLTPAKAAEHAARERRRAGALRENLRRRKDQARGKSTAPRGTRRAEDGSSA